MPTKSKTDKMLEAQTATIGELRKLRDELVSRMDGQLAVLDLLVRLNANTEHAATNMAAAQAEMEAQEKEEQKDKEDLLISFNRRNNEVWGNGWVPPKDAA